MTLEEAQEIQNKLAKHNPFVRLIPELQQLADTANKVLKSSNNHEIFEEGLF